MNDLKWGDICNMFPMHTKKQAIDIILDALQIKEFHDAHAPAVDLFQIEHRALCKTINEEM